MLDTGGSTVVFSVYVTVLIIVTLAVVGPEVVTKRLVVTMTVTDVVIFLLCVVVSVTVTTSVSVSVTVVGCKVLVAVNVFQKVNTSVIDCVRIAMAVDVEMLVNVTRGVRACLTPSP